MRIGKNKFGFPMLIIKRTWLSVNEGGRWFNFAIGKSPYWPCLMIYVYAFGRRWSWQTKLKN